MEKINFIHIPKNGGSSIKQICRKNKILNYNWHDTDVYNTKLTNQLIIIRNPIDRFISAVYYSLQKWSHQPHVKYLIDNQIDTPEKWIQILMNPENEHYSHLMEEMIKNKSQKIGTKLIEYKYTYLPQYFWINNPRFVIIMDNFTDEIKYFMNKYKINGNIQCINSTKKIQNILSEESINFLKEFYKQDLILYEKYKNITMEDRL